MMVEGKVIEFLINYLNYLLKNSNGTVTLILLDGSPEFQKVPTPLLSLTTG